MSLLVLDFDGNVLEEVNTETKPKKKEIPNSYEELGLELQLVEIDLDGNKSQNK